MTVSDQDFANVMAGLEQTVDILAGRAEAESFRVHVPQTVDVRAIRKRTKLSQAAFAARFGFSPGAVRDWEQARRQPEASARILLTVIDREPEAVDRALAGGT